MKKKTTHIILLVIGFCMMISLPVWSQPTKSDIYANGYIRINTGPYIFVIDEKDTISPNVVYLFGPRLEVFVPVERSRKSLSKNNTPDPLSSSQLEFRIYRNSRLAKDWTAINELSLLKEDTVEEIPENKRNLVLREVSVSNVASESKVVLGRKIPSLSIDNRLLYQNSLNIKDSVQIDLRLTNQSNKIKSTIIKRLPIRPFLRYTLLEKEIDQYFLKDKGLLDRLNNLPNSQLTSTYLIQRSDSLPTRINLDFPSSARRILFRFANIMSMEDTVLNIRLYNADDSVLRSENSTNEILLNDLEPGNHYRLLVSNIQQPENTVTYNIQLAPLWYQTWTFKILTGLLLILLLLFYIYMLYRNKVRKHQREKDRIDWELKSIRSQLNPHFVFNSLNSIQGLVNADKKEKANLYLSEFSKLMRETLDGNNREFIPLGKELSLLDRYLKLEQLRFGFQYTVHLGNGVPVSSIELPALLLQPLVENAVKHGVAEKMQAGQLSIWIDKSGSDLQIKINDNGKGFDPNAISEEGFGIKLTRDRILLLNQMQENGTILMNFEKKPDGMTITLTFKEIC